MFADLLRSEVDLVSAAVALGARSVCGWSPQEERLASKATPFDREWSDDLVRQIQSGKDPLGAALIRLRSPETRRALGATFTPNVIVSSMLRWAKSTGITPERVVEPGTGSGRFLMSAARRFVTAELVGIEVDPLPAMIARANLAACGLAKRSQILLSDYRLTALSPARGVTLYL